MMQISSTPKPPLVSARTAKYVAAFMREGDGFDYHRWVQQIRKEEAQGNVITKSLIPRLSVQISIPMSSPTSLGALSNSVQVSTARAIPISRGRWRSTDRFCGNAANRRLEKVRGAWDNFQTSRARDAVYGYLEAVFATVMHYKVRRRTNKLVRNALKFAGVRFEEGADLFSTVIRCTSDDHADGKTISKWARALRYVALCKVRARELETFMKELGGVNACADRYAKVLGRGAR